MFLRFLWFSAPRNSSKSRQPSFCQWNCQSKRGSQSLRSNAATSSPLAKLRCADERPSRRASSRIVAISNARNAVASAPATDQQPRPGDRRVGHCAEQLRIVGKPVPLVRAGPRPVEHELAVRIAFEIERRGGDEAIAVVEAEVIRLPAVRGLRRSRGARGRTRNAWSTNGLSSGSSAFHAFASMSSRVAWKRAFIAGENSTAVIPAKAGIHLDRRSKMGPGFRRDDGPARLRRPNRGTSRHRAPPCSRSRPR